MQTKDLPLHKKDMLRFTEIYYEDALRFAQYVQATTGGEIELARENAEEFPEPPNGYALGEMTECFKIGSIEIAYIRADHPLKEEAKKRNRSLYRYIFGSMIREYRMQHGYTLDEISEQIGYKVSNLKSLESGRYNANIDVISKVLEVMDVHLEIVANT